MCRRPAAPLLPFALLALVALRSEPAAADLVAGARATLDPNVLRALDTGRTGPAPQRTIAVGRAHVLVELSAPVDGDMLATLQRAGATLSRGSDGKPLFYGRFVPAFVDRAAATALVALAGVRRVSSIGGRGPRPLDQSAKLIRLADARGAKPQLDLLTGAGTLIGDIDTMVDPFHPTFFKGDGGYYDWIDRNHDGLFAPGVDAIDLNRNGVADSGETAQLLPAATVDAYDAALPAARPSGFDPSIDWLYLDSNGNGKRDYGAAAGFTDATPAFGEPLFVPDDVNQNGKLDVGERVVRLSTSKFRAISVSVNEAGMAGGPPLVANETYTRGTNLSATQVNFTNGAAEGQPDAFHATGVNTILVGDVPLVGRRWVGIAPRGRGRARVGGLRRAAP